MADVQRRLTTRQTALDGPLIGCVAPSATTGLGATLIARTLKGNESSCTLPEGFCRYRFPRPPMSNAG